MRAYAVESALFRTAGLIDAAIGGSGHDARGRSRAALEEFAIEASMLKVAGSEMLDFVVDENVQIHGGNGFVADYPAERHYRDARVNRIFEGTNEINRLLVPGMLIKRCAQGRLPIVLAAAKALQDELLSPAPRRAATATTRSSNARRTVAALKKTALHGARPRARRRYGEKLPHEQEVADARSRTSSSTRSSRRARCCAPSRPRDAGRRRAPLAAPTRPRVLCARRRPARRRRPRARCSRRSTTGDALRTSLAALRRLLKVAPVDTVAARRRLADADRRARKGYRLCVTAACAPRS